MDKNDKVDKNDNSKTIIKSTYSQKISKILPNTKNWLKIWFNSKFLKNLAYTWLRQEFSIILDKTCYKMHNRKLLTIVEFFENVIIKVFKNC